MNISATIVSGQRPSVHYFLQLFCRYFIAAMMFFYAAAKLFGTQFTAEPYQLDIPVGELRGFELTWIFYGYSHAYGWIIAGSQIAAGLLIMFRPTLRLGLLLFLAIMTNILMLNFFYGIGTGGWQDPKITAVLLFVMALYLFFSDWKAFYHYAFGTPYTPTAAIPSIVKKLHWLKYALIPLLFVGAFGGIYALKQAVMPTSPLAGAWEFEGNSDYSRLSFNTASFCTLNTTTNERFFGDCFVNEAAQTVQINVGDPSGGVFKSVFGFEGTYEFNGDTLRLSNSSGESLSLQKVHYAYGNPNYR